MLCSRVPWTRPVNTGSVYRPLIAQFLRKSRFSILAKDRQTDEQMDSRSRITDGQACCMKPLSLSQAAA